MWSWRNYFWDAAALLGLAVVTGGLALIYLPVAFIFVGAVLVVFSVFGANTHGPHNRRN